MDGSPLVSLRLCADDLSYDCTFGVSFLTPLFLRLRFIITHNIYILLSFYPLDQLVAMSYMQIGKERNVGFVFNPLFMLIAFRFGLESVFELDLGCRVVLERAIC